MPRSIVRHTGVLAVLGAITLVSPIVAQDAAAPVQPDSAQVAAALTMIELMRLGDDMLSGLEAMLGDSTDPNGMPQDYRQAVMRKARVRMPELLQLVAPMYAARLTPAEIAQVSAFFRSPAAQHFMAASDAISTEMEGMGERWAYKVLGEVMIELGNAPPPAPPASDDE